MINNLVSIDIDCLFECDEYAKYMNYDLDADLAWDVVELIADRMNLNLKPNMDAVSKVVSILENRCSNAKVRIIQEHDEIIDVMKEFGCKKSTVYNIDFHQDVTYNNDDDKLNIENWARYAKKLGLMESYNWLHREMSDVRVDSPFKFNRDNLLDINELLLPEIDLVVICISHHFTPRKYWDTIPNVLLNYVRGDLKHFQEVTTTTLSKDILSGLDDYLIDGTMPNIYRLFRCDDTYIVIERDGLDTVCISMLDVSGKGNLFRIKEVIDKMFTEYNYIEFCYKSGIRNEKFIHRLAKNYTIVDFNEGYYRLMK